MRILFATMQFGRGYSQGTERYLSLLSAELRAAGHETLFYAGDPEHRGPRVAAGAVVQDQPRVLAARTFGWMTVNGDPNGAAAILDQLRPDLVHLANPGHIGLAIIAAARARNIPVVVSVVDFWWLCPKQTLHHYRGGVCSGDVTWRDCLHCIAASHEVGALRTLSRSSAAWAVALPLLMFGRSIARGLPLREITDWKRRREIALQALNNADGVIFFSRTGESLLRPGLSHPYAVRIQNGLEARWFAPPAAPRRPKPIRPEDLRIGYAGALAPHKGVHILLDALRQLGWTQTELRIAAAAESSQYGQSLRQSAAGLRVEFLGQVPPEGMPAYLDDLDLLVVPSLWPENVPIIILEAFARRTPVIASDMPGIAELFSDSGVLFQTGSAPSLADCLTRWLSNPAPPQLPTVSTAAEIAARTLEVYAQARQKAASR